MIVQDVGTNTAGFSPADDNGTEVCTGIVIDGPTEAAGGLADTDADGSTIACVEDADDGGEDRDELGEADDELGDVGGGDALRLPACLPTKNAPMQIPMTAKNPSIDRVRLLAGVMSWT